MDENKLNMLLAAWEETYKKGQLTLWILLSLAEGKKYADEIKNFVEEKSRGTMTCENQSLYRVLRKFEHVGVLEYEPGKGDKGPERKYYYLTELGRQLVDRFTERNISLFYLDDVRSLIER